MGILHESKRHACITHGTEGRKGEKVYYKSKSKIKCHVYDREKKLEGMSKIYFQLVL